MIQPQVLSLIAGKPLAVTPAKLQAVTDFLQTRHEFKVNFSGIKVDSGEPILAAERQPNGGSIYGDDVSIINITGSLVNRAASGSSGMTNYRSLQQVIKSTVDDRDTGGILLDFQTSGGMLVGCKRTFDIIRQAAREKPVWAFVDAHSYSAGFYLACGAERIILADDNCGVGSVGVIAMHLDMSKNLEKEGLHYEVIKAGAKKDEYSSLKPLAAETRAELQAGVDRSRLVFAADVAEARGLSQGAVLKTEAGCFEGQAAIDVGFADEIAPLEDAIGMLQERISSGDNYYYNADSGLFAETEGFDIMAEKDGKGMNTAQRVGAMLGADPDGFAAAMETFGFQSSASVNTQFQDLREEYFAKGKEEGLSEGKQQGLDQAVSVLAAVELGGASVETAKGLIEQGLDQEAAANVIQEQRAAQSQGELKDSSTTAATGDGPHPFINFGDVQK